MRQKHSISFTREDFRWIALCLCGWKSQPKERLAEAEAAGLEHAQ